MDGILCSVVGNKKTTLTYALQ